MSDVKYGLSMKNKFLLFFSYKCMYINQELTPGLYRTIYMYKIMKKMYKVKDKQ